MTRLLARRIAAIVCLFALGCGANQSPAKSAAVPVVAVAVNAAPAPAGAGGAVPLEIAPERKIIFNGMLDVEVKDFAMAYADVTKQMQQFKAYFTKTEISGSSGTRRFGTFTIKVPVQHFQTLMESIAALGNPIRNTTDSQDVTDEFVDVEARIKNLKVEEEAFNKILKEAGSRLEDVFRIREQIKLNREQIERAEARLNLLSKQTSLSTITLTLRDKEEYVAPTAAKLDEKANFRERAGGTFASSWSSLVSLAESVALFVVAVSPWLPVVLLVGVPFGLLFRKLARRVVTPA